ncbi:MAG: carbon storage regulator [Planctomycetes bacterium]|nr:carbon storage regulator [Planctomycetota bacterium]
MLVLSRKAGDRIMIGDHITVVVTKVSGNRISLGIEAPPNVRIVRGELAEIVRSFDDGPSGKGPSEDVTSSLGIPTFDFAVEPVVHRAR